MRYRVLLLLATSIGVALLLSPWPPLGVSGEWTWPRHALPMDLPEALDRLVWPLVCGGLIVAYAAMGMRRIEHVGALGQRLLLLGLAGVSFLWITGVRQAAPSPHRELRPLWILYDKYASGYFLEAVVNTQTTPEMLAGYEAKMAEGDVLHAGTHPPGLLLMNRGLLALTQANPSIVEVSEGFQNREAVRMFREVERASGVAAPLLRPELAALHLSSLLSTLLAAMTVLPVFDVTRRLRNSGIAWRAAVLTIAIPTIGVFVPRSDVVYPFTGMVLTWACVASCLAERRLARWFFALMAGCILFACLLLSLAHVPIIVMLALFALGNLLQDFKKQVRHASEAAVVMIVWFLLLCGIFHVATDCNLCNVWRMNLSNHAGFYSQSVRTWSAWILVNPFELAFAVGLPMAVVAGLTIVQIQKQCRTLGAKSLTKLQLFVGACAITWTLLWLSGKNMGEAARLWCFLTPWVAVAAANPYFGNGRKSRQEFLLLLVAQLVVATITAGRVSGFLEF